MFENIIFYDSDTPIEDLTLYKDHLISTGLELSEFPKPYYDDNFLLRPHNITYSLTKIDEPNANQRKISIGLFENTSGYLICALVFLYFVSNIY